MSRVGGWRLRASRVWERIRVPNKAENPKAIKASAAETKSLSSEARNTISREMRETVIKKEPPRIPRKIKTDIGKFGD